MLRKIAVVGPESTGKSELAHALATHLRTVWVPEFARFYLDLLDRPYRADDLVDIARGQLAWERGLASQGTDWLVCDTNLLVIQVWSEFKYGYLLPDLAPLIDLRPYTLHLLTDIDLPWQDDPLREHPHAREALLAHYRRSLDAAQVPYAVVRGQGTQRLASALAALTPYR
jgi:NadR type nicotinamide-nucleotide adenylyltransferase